MAVVLGLRHIRPYLYGRRFLRYTDHVEVEQCRYCQRVEDQDTANPAVSTLQPIPLDKERVPQVSQPKQQLTMIVDPQQLQLEQSQDLSLSSLGC